VSRAAGSQHGPAAPRSVGTAHLARLREVHLEMVEAVLHGDGLERVALLASRAAGAPVAIVVPRLGGATDVTTEWSQTVVRFQGSDGEFAMAYVPGETGVAFWGDDLPDPGPDRTYEIWMIDDGTPIKGGCVAPVDGRIAVYVEANVGTTDTMAVTVEPTSCPEEPTSDPVLTAQLS